MTWSAKIFVIFACRVTLFGSRRKLQFLIFPYHDDPSCMFSSMFKWNQFSYQKFISNVSRKFISSDTKRNEITFFFVVFGGSSRRLTVSPVVFLHFFHLILYIKALSLTHVVCICEKRRKKKVDQTSNYANCAGFCDSFIIWKCF